MELGNVGQSTYALAMKAHEYSAVFAETKIFDRF
jgi:hypothetical protein